MCATMVLGAAVTAVAAPSNDDYKNAGQADADKTADSSSSPKTGDVAEYSCAMKSHFRKSGNQMSGKWKSSYASLLA